MVIPLLGIRELAHEPVDASVMYFLAYPRSSVYLAIDKPLITHIGENLKL